MCTDLIMGIVAGTVFWQASDDAQSVMGILFQSMFFVSLGAMLKVPYLFDVRSIFYKHQDANFFPTWAYVLGKTIGRQAHISCFPLGCFRLHLIIAFIVGLMTPFHLFHVTLTIQRAFLPQSLTPLFSARSYTGLWALLTTKEPPLPTTSCSSFSCWSHPRRQD